MSAPLPTSPPTLIGRSVVFFDGVCVLCHGAVRFIRHRDRAGAFGFAALQDAGAQAFFARRQIETRGLDSIYLVTALGTPQERILSASSAVLVIARRLPWPWRAAYALIAVPRPVRDWCYGWVAKRRYRWFGRHDACPLPSASDRATLVDDDALARL